jgi:hypothetical protein
MAIHTLYVIILSPLLVRLTLPVSSSYFWLKQIISGGWMCRDEST